MPIKAVRIEDGEIITKPGVYRMSLDWYHQQCCDGPSTSSSELRTLFNKSPAHAWVDSSLNTKREEPDEEEDAKKRLTEKKNFILGRAAHHLLLGEDDFHTGFIVRPDEAPDGTGRPWNGNNSSCKEWLVKQAKAGRTVLTSANIKQIRGMAYALAAHSLVQTGLLEGDVELSLVWQDKKTGIWLKSRPDVIPTASGDFADLKTTSFYGDDLDRQARDCRYDIQAALAKWGCKAVLRMDLVSFSLVYASVKPPHLVDVLMIHQNDIGEAEKDLRVAVDTLAWCHRNNNWFGPSGTQQKERLALFNSADTDKDWFRKDREYKRERLGRTMAEAEEVGKLAADMGA